MKKQAVINVSDPENIVTLAKFLFENGWEIFTTGKNATLLSNNNIAANIEEGLGKNGNVDAYVSLIESVTNTGFHSEIENMDKIREVHLVCVNMTPSFKQIEDIREAATYINDVEDLSPTLVQVAAKNYRNVIVLTDAADYNETIVRLRTDSVTDDYRIMLAAKAFNMLAVFNSAVATSILNQAKSLEVNFPKFLPLPYQKVMTLSSGVNAQQKAAFYSISKEIGAASGFKKFSAEKSTFCSVANVTAAWKSVFRFSKFLKNPHAVNSTTFDGAPYTTQFTPAAGSVYTVAVIYGSAVGAALGSSVAESCRKTFSRNNIDYRKAVLGCSSVIDEEAARLIVQTNVAEVVAPSYTLEAITVFASNPNIHIVNSTHEMLYDFEFISIDGGILLQSEDDTLFTSWRTVTHNRPTQEQADAMSFGMLAAMSAKHEVATLITDMTVIDLCCNELEILNFKNMTEREDSNEKKFILVCNSVLPFTDSVKTIIERNVAAIIQTGGSENDEAFIDFCDEHNIAMVFTGITHISI